MPTLCLAVHGAEYPVTLRDSPSTRALVRQLPMTLHWRNSMETRNTPACRRHSPLTPYNLAPFRPETSCSTAQTALFYSTKVSPLPIPILRWDK